MNRRLQWQETASRRYTYEKVKKKMERQKEKHGWEFLFLGTNWKKRIDADFAERD